MWRLVCWALMTQSPDHRDAELVSQIAHEFVARYGAEALAELRNRAELAAGIGDKFSTDTWLEIADAVADRSLPQGGASLFLHPDRASMVPLAIDPVAVERWHAVKARMLALGMPSHLAEKLTRIAGEMERHAASLAVRNERLRKRQKGMQRRVMRDCIG